MYNQMKKAKAEKEQNKATEQMETNILKAKSNQILIHKDVYNNLLFTAEKYKALIHLHEVAETYATLKSRNQAAEAIHRAAAEDERRQQRATPKSENAPTLTKEEKSENAKRKKSERIKKLVEDATHLRAKRLLPIHTLFD